MNLNFFGAKNLTFTHCPVSGFLTAWNKYTSWFESSIAYTQPASADKLLGEHATAVNEMSIEPRETAAQS